MEVEDPTSYQEVIDLANHKEWMDGMRDEIDSTIRKRFENPLILHLDVSLLETNEFSR